MKEVESVVEVVVNGKGDGWVEEVGWDGMAWDGMGWTALGWDGWMDGEKKRKKILGRLYFA